MSATAVDTTLTALVAAYTAVTPSGWTTIDGQPRDPGRKSLCVGWDESGQPPVAVTRDLADMTGVWSAEIIDISNLLTLWVGNEPLSQARTELLTAFDTYEAALTADPHLGLPSVLAYSTALEYLPSKRTEGVLVQARFTVRCEVS